MYAPPAEDGAISFASDRLAIPDGEQPHEWHELPPGHYISGKVPKMHQVRSREGVTSLRGFLRECRVRCPSTQTCVPDISGVAALGSSGGACSAGVLMYQGISCTTKWARTASAGMLIFHVIILSECLTHPSDAVADAVCPDPPAAGTA